MKIIQLVTNLNEGDAIGNDILAIHRALREEGFESAVMAQTIHPNLTELARGVDFSRIEKDDLLLFHKATGDQLGGLLSHVPCRKGLIYHNITPARYFLPYDAVMAWNLGRGRRQLRQLAANMDFGWGDSLYNCRELIEAGFPEENVSVLPILMGKRTVDSAPDPLLVKKLAAIRGTKMLFIGRIAPNKKQEDIMKVFYCYLRHEDPDAVLYLVGSWDGMEKYYAKLKGFAADLGLRDDQVVFTGLVSEAEKAAYLKGADVFVCMSEHEGFCVPLLEAIDRDLPIAAFASSALPETLGDNGMLFERKDYGAIARQISRLRDDVAFRDEVLSRQRANARRFDRETVRQRLLTLVNQALSAERKIRP